MCLSLLIFLSLLITEAEEAARSGYQVWQVMRGQFQGRDQLWCTDVN